MSIDQNQENWIKSKVKELGSVQATKQFYNKDCLVDRWATAYATSFFKALAKTAPQNSQGK